MTPLPKFQKRLVIAEDGVNARRTNDSELNFARNLHSATLLPDGNVLVAGGFSGGGLTSVEIYDRIAQSWSTNRALNTIRWTHTATLLPNGSVFVAGGRSNSGAGQAATEVFDPGSGFWSPTGVATVPRFRAKSLLLPTGKVLFVAGTSNNLTTTYTELFDPALGTWSPAAPMRFARTEPTTTLLFDGSVLVAGGFATTNFVRVAERYNPTTDMWQTNGPLNTPRSRHSATLLLNGKVLIAGGNDGAPFANSRSAELYEPATGSFTPTGSMNIGREDHQAVLLKNGKVLVVGGFGTNSFLNSAELFDPIAGSWSLTASLPLALANPTTTLLPDGKVLVAAGISTNTASAGAFVFDPQSGTNGTWATVGSLNIARWRHSAVLLPNGKVLVVGGEDTNVNTVTNAEIFDPAVGKWTLTGSLITGLYEANLTLLPNGNVLAASGFLTRTAQVYNVGLSFPDSSEPQISTVTGLSLGQSLSLTGSGFRGVSESSGGNGSQNSASDCPVVQLRNIESGQVLFLSSADWRTNSYVSLPVSGFPPGPALVTVFVNGIPSASRILLVSSGSSIFLCPTRLSDGSFQFEFAGTSGGGYTAVATTNISLAHSNWTTLGAVSEVSPGQFRFTDFGATNHPQRFYRVSMP